ncbi:hypothetical protein [Endozoicomonas sp. 8E]|uniref:hypothetical protein n=1 Tax=Endozoicomonas sp. 8E TaxID=3035692 RepID=UPI0029390607|nr:hypothetical protein [Endozoicomonas sp. 8E]WOG26048.1 hypothetical protein P6910_15880 [Endozoicomonas sp. 8E]
MKNHRAIVITRIIFIISVLYSYNANASPLYNAFNSLATLIDEVHLKEFQLTGRVLYTFSHSVLNRNLEMLKLYCASLLARQQPRAVPSKKFYVRKMKERLLCRVPECSSQHEEQNLDQLTSRCKGVGYFPFHESGEVYDDGQYVLFSEIDALEDREISEKAKEFLSKFYNLLKNDELFLTKCTNSGLDSEYKITMDLMSAVLH